MTTYTVHITPTFRWLCGKCAQQQCYAHMHIAKDVGTSRPKESCNDCDGEFDRQEAP